MNKVAKQVVRNIISGILIVLPAVTTIYVFVVLFEVADSALPRVFHSIIPGIPAEWPPFVGLLLILVLAYFAGVAAKNYFGRKIIEVGNSIISNIPLMNKVYLGVQQILDAVAGQKKKLFDKVVLIQYPKDGAYCIGFQTSSSGSVVAKTLEKKMVSVFIPTTPNPTSGFLLYYPADEVVDLDINIETAIKIIMSAGVVSAEQIRKTQHLYVMPSSGKKWNWLGFRRRGKGRGVPHDPRD